MVRTTVTAFRGSAGVTIVIHVGKREAHLSLDGSGTVDRLVMIDENMNHRTMKTADGLPLAVERVVDWVTEEVNAT